MLLRVVDIIQLYEMFYCVSLSTGNKRLASLQRVALAIQRVVKYMERLPYVYNEARSVIIFTTRCRKLPLSYNRPENLSNSAKNAKWGLLRRSRSFKVIEVGTNRKRVCAFLLVINRNWHPILYRLRVIAAYCSNFGHIAFSSHPLGA